MSRGLAFLLISQGAFLLCGYIIHVSLARRLGPEGYGVFGFIITVLTWVEILVYGSSNLAVKYVQSQPGRFREWNALFFRAQCLLTVSFFLPLAGLAVIVGWKSERYGYLFLIAFLDLLFIGFYQLYVGFLNGFRLYTRQAIASIVYSISKAFGMVFLVYLGLGVRGALLGNVFSSMAGLLAGYLLFRSSSAIYKTGHIPEDITVNTMPSLVRLISESILYTLIPLMVNLVLNLDVWVINFLLGSSEVGLYVSAGTLSRMIFFLFSASFMASFPAMVSSFNMGIASKKTIRLFQLTGEFFMALALPSALFLSVNGKPIIRVVFGNQYLQASTATSILSLAMLFLTVFVFLVYVLYAAGKYAKAVRLLVFPVCIDAIISPIAVKLWGINGAAFATGLVSAAGLLVAYLSVKKLLVLTWQWRRMTLLILLCCLCFLPFLFLSGKYMLSLPLSLAGFILYIGITVSTGLISKKNVYMAIKSVVRGK